MIRSRAITAALVALATVVVGPPPAAHAGESVTYEVFSNKVARAEIKYYDGSGRQLLEGEKLPFHKTVSLDDPRRDAFVHVRWWMDITHQLWKPDQFVTTRIYFGKTLVCEQKLNDGFEACYGRLASFPPGSLIGSDLPGNNG